MLSVDCQLHIIMANKKSLFESNVYIVVTQDCMISIGI